MDRTLSLVRQYVKHGQGDNRREAVVAVMRLLQDRGLALVSLDISFEAFIGQDRFRLYTLAGYLVQDWQALSQFYVERLPLEDDPLCRQLISIALKVCLQHQYYAP